MRLGRYLPGDLPGDLLDLPLGSSEKSAGRDQVTAYPSRAPSRNGPRYKFDGLEVLVGIARVREGLQVHFEIRGNDEPLPNGLEPALSELLL